MPEPSLTRLALASGLINTSQQIGGALGIALLSTIAVSTTEDELARGIAEPAALTEGFVNAFWAGAVIAFAGVLVSIFFVRGVISAYQSRRPRSRRSSRRRSSMPSTRPGEWSRTID